MQLTDLSTGGTLVADAVRIERIGDLMTTASIGAPVLMDETSSKVAGFVAKDDATSTSEPLPAMEAVEASDVANVEARHGPKLGDPGKAFRGGAATHLASIRSWFGSRQARRDFGPRTATSGLIDPQEAGDR